MNTNDDKISRAETLRLVADYMASEGCGCCRDSCHDDDAARLGELLGAPKYSDGSGYDFARFTTKKCTGPIPIR